MSQNSIEFDNSYARLPERFYARVKPTVVAGPRLIQVNRALAFALGVDGEFLASDEGTQILAGNRIADGSEPLAQAYAGHQFGHFVPQLGDGRANLLGEVVAPDGKRYDVQLKGSGPTPYSRRGDGRAALGPVLREYVVSEAMTALGIPSTRALAAVLTGEWVHRERTVPGAILTRVAASHLRVGTFQYFAARQDIDSLRTLAEFAIARHYPELAASDQPYLGLLQGVIARQARLIAGWMLVGFIHGVMNTDNMSISGETIDYGPCAFLEAYDSGKVYSSIDAQGRYAYGNQPHAAQWNLTRLAEALLPLLVEETGSQERALQAASDALGAFTTQFETAHREGLRRKIGLLGDRVGDDALCADLLACMHDNQADFTRVFRGLSEAAASAGEDASVRALFAEPQSFDAWAARWRERLTSEGGSPAERAVAMRHVNPSVIPRNHLVEAMIVAAVERADFGPFEEMLAAIADPYLDRPEFVRYTVPAKMEELVAATFCGT